MKESISKASDHIKPCNIAQSEQHNKRDEDYIKSLNPKRLYIRLSCGESVFRTIMIG